MPWPARVLRRLGLAVALAVLAIANGGASCGGDDDDAPATVDAAGAVVDAGLDAASCVAVACEASHPGCVAGACDPATGRCAAERCVEDAPAILTGTVVGIQLGPLADATVRVDGGSGSVMTQPDGGGAFSLAVPFHESDLRVSRPGFADYTRHLTFGPDERSDGNDVLLQPVLAWYDVTVWQAVNTPLPGASVSIAFENGGGAAGSTDGLGRVSFALQPVGVAFTLEVSAPGVSPYVGHNAPLTPGSNTIIVGLY